MATIYPRNGKWHISYYLPNGKRVQKSTKIPLEQKKLAEAFLKQIEIKQAKGCLGWESGPSISIMESIKKWISSISAKNSSAGTRARYRIVIRHFIKFLEDNFPNAILLSDITPEMIQGYVSFRAKLRHPNTVRQEARIISVWFNFCIRMDWINNNPVDRISRPKKVAEHIQFFTADEVRRIFKAAPPHRRDLWEFLYRTGSRIGETSRLRVKDVNFLRNVILYPPASTKAKRPDEVEIADKLLPILKRLCAEKKPGDLVFSDAPTWGVRYNILRTGFQKFLASLDPPIEGTLHTWKHSFVSGLVTAGVSIMVVKKMARHVNITTTMLYAHLSPNADKGEVNRLAV
jgi:integrase